MKGSHFAFRPKKIPVDAPSFRSVYLEAALSAQLARAALPARPAEPEVERLLGAALHQAGDRVESQAVLAAAVRQALSKADSAPALQIVQ